MLYALVPPQIRAGVASAGGVAQFVFRAPVHPIWGARRLSRTGRAGEVEAVTWFGVAQ